MSLDVCIHRFTGRRVENMFAKVRGLQLTMNYSLPTGVAIGLGSAALFFPSERHWLSGPRGRNRPRESQSLTGVAPAIAAVSAGAPPP